MIDPIRSKKRKSVLSSIRRHEICISTRFLQRAALQCIDKFSCLRRPTIVCLTCTSESKQQSRCSLFHPFKFRDSNSNRRTVLLSCLPLICLVPTSPEATEADIFIFSMSLCLVRAHGAAVGVGNAPLSREENSHKMIIRVWIDRRRNRPQFAEHSNSAAGRGEKG